mgnify:CR=1 FL=1
MSKYDYKVLGLQSGATQEQIRQAYRKKALKKHPDKGGNEKDFQELNAAYERLKGVSQSSESKSRPAPEPEPGPEPKPKPKRTRIQYPQLQKNVYEDFDLGEIKAGSYVEIYVLYQFGYFSQKFKVSKPFPPDSSVTSLEKEGGRLGTFIPAVVLKGSKNPQTEELIFLSPGYPTYSTGHPSNYRLFKSIIPSASAVRVIDDMSSPSKFSILEEFLSQHISKAFIRYDEMTILSSEEQQLLMEAVKSNDLLRTEDPQITNFSTLKEFTDIIWKKANGGKMIPRSMSEYKVSNEVLQSENEELIAGREAFRTENEKLKEINEVLQSENEKLTAELIKTLELIEFVAGESGRLKSKTRKKSKKHKSRKYRKTRRR